MKEMSTREYKDHIQASFPKAHFKGDKLLFSRSALLDGLEIVEMQTIHTEHLIEIHDNSDIGRDWIQNEVIQGLRKMQAVVNMLITSMDGIIFKTNGK